jgi:Domain of unknown function (DUF4185)
MRRAFAWLVVAALAACGGAPASGPSTAPELGALGHPPVVTARDGGASVAIGGKILWLFDDTLMTVTGADGFSYRSATAAWGEGASLTLDEPLDAAGAPFQLLPYTDDELAYNRANGPMERFALWPGSAIAGGDGALVFFASLKVHPGDLDYEGLGAGVATLAPGSTVASRAPGLLFAPPAPSFSVGAVVTDGFVHLYACDPSGTLGSDCRVARAPVDMAQAAAAWMVWDGTAWNADLTAGQPVLHGAPGDLSVSWNDHAGAFIAVHSAIFSDDVVLHTAPRPEGPWTDARPLLVGAHHAGTTNYAAKEHPELATDGGRTLFVTYAHPLGGFDEAVRVATPALP